MRIRATLQRRPMRRSSGPVRRRGRELRPRRRRRRPGPAPGRGRRGRSARPASGPSPAAGGRPRAGGRRRRRRRRRRGRGRGAPGPRRGAARRTRATRCPAARAQVWRRRRGARGARRRGAPPARARRARRAGAGAAAAGAPRRRGAPAGGDGDPPAAAELQLRGVVARRAPGRRGTRPGRRRRPSVGPPARGPSEGEHRAVRVGATVSPPPSRAIRARARSSASSRIGCSSSGLWAAWRRGTRRETLQADEPHRRVRRVHRTQGRGNGVLRRIRTHGAVAEAGDDHPDMAPAAAPPRVPVPQAAVRRRRRGVGDAPSQVPERRFQRSHWKIAARVRVSP